jgi:AraC family transcriptional regulator of arabinose operon
MNRRRSAVTTIFGDVTYPPGGSFGPRVQQDIQLVVIETGEVTIRIDDWEIHVPAQHGIVLLPQHREHFCFARLERTRHTWCAIAPTAVAPALAQHFVAQHVFPVTSRLQRLMDYGLDIPPGSVSDGLVEAIGSAALHAALVENEQAQQRSPASALVRFAQRYIEQNLAEALDLSQIAAAAGVTPQHLTRLFRRELHITPMRYLWQLRTQRGVELLGETGLSIAEIAERVGFQSPFHFSRLVRQQYGCGPRELRQRLWRGG